MDKEEVKKMVLGLLTSKDRKLQDQIIDEYFTDDVEFLHTLFSVQGKEAVRAMYRLATTSWNYKVDFIDIVAEDGKMALWVTLKLKMPPFYILRYHFPTIVLLYFRNDPVTGRPKICKQVDHHSAYVLTWLLGWPWIDLSQMVLRPLAGRLFVLFGSVLDTAMDAVDGAKEMVTSLLVTQPQLPPSTRASDVANSRASTSGLKSS